MQSQNLYSGPINGEAISVLGQGCPLIHMIIVEFIFVKHV